MAGSVASSSRPAVRCLDRFRVGRALEGLLPGPLPIGDRLFQESRLGIMMRDQGGLRRRGFRKAVHQHLGNPLVILLTGTPQ